MYTQNKQQANNRILVISNHYKVISPAYVLVIGLLLFAATNIRADTITSNPQNTMQYTNFYHPPYKPTDLQFKPVYNNIFSRVKGDYSALIYSQPELIADKNLAFNYLWILQYQPQYRHKQGGAAAGKILRLGAKALYEYYNGSIGEKLDDETTSPLSNMDYRLRFSSDKVKLGIEYQF